MTSKRHFIFYPAVMLGFAIINSLICVLFMFILTKATDLLYTSLPDTINFPQRFWPLVYCIAGGLLVGIVVKKFGMYPKLLLEVFALFKRTGRVGYENKFIPKDTVSAFIILLFGAALGPEAVLTGLAGSVGTYTVDIMERNLGYKRLRENHPTFKRIVFLLQWAVGVVLFMLLTGMLKLPSFVYRYTETSFQFKELIWFVPLLALGVVLGMIFIWTGKGFAKLFKPEKGKSMYPKVMLTAVMLGVTGVFAPLLLFSGETQIPDLVEQAGSMAPEFLIIFAVAKLLLAALCLQTGWRGGNIFPLVFASFSMAFGIAALLPVDAAFAASVVFASLFAFVTKQPAIACVFVVLYFPFIFIPFIILSAFLACPKESLGMLKKLYYKLRKKDLN